MVYTKSRVGPRVAASTDAGDASDRPKYQLIRDELAAAIRAGAMPVGSRLPTERELSKRYGVNRMTVRQATAALVRVGLVVKRHPLGNFVRDHLRPGAQRHVNLICREGDSTLADTFIDHALRIAATRSCAVRVLRVYPGSEHVATEALAGPDPSVLLGGPVARGDDEFGQVLRRAAGRVALIGARLDHLGIRSVVGDDAMGLRLAVEHLHARGHRRIALVGSLAEAGHPLMELQIQYWRNAMLACGATDDAASERNVIRLKPAEGEGGRMRAAYDAVRSHVRRAGRSRPTALIGLAEEVAIGANAALHELGLAVPGDVSLVGYAGTYRSAMSVPALTSVDVGIDAHLEAAFAHLDAAEAGGDAAGAALLTVIRPTLIERDSVASRA